MLPATDLATNIVASVSNQNLTIGYTHLLANYQTTSVANVAYQAALDLKAPLASPAFTGDLTVAGMVSCTSSINFYANLDHGLRATGDLWSVGQNVSGPLGPDSFEIAYNPAPNTPVTAGGTVFQIDVNGTVTIPGTINLNTVIIGGTNLTSTLNLKAALASPAFTGTPTAITQATIDNSTKIATTGFVQNNIVNMPLVRFQVYCNSGGG